MLSSTIDELSSLCLPQINFEWENCLPACLCVVKNLLMFTVELRNRSLSGSSKSFWQKESRQYDSQIPTSFTLAWEWIGSMGRHWHPRMHNQTPCWCYAVLLCAPPENQEKVGQISHFSNFIFMGFYLGKSMKMCMKVWVYYFFLLALMVRKGHWDPLLRPPKLECFWHQDACLA